MMRTLFLLVAVTVVFSMVAMPVEAGTTIDSWLTFSLTKEVETLKAVSAPQARMTYDGKEICQWSEAMGEYMKSLPVGSGLGEGIRLQVWPNVNAGTEEILAMYYSTYELMLRGKEEIRINESSLDPDDKTARMGLKQISRDASSKRFEVTFDLNQMGNEPQCIWFYGLIHDAKKHTKRFFLLTWTSKKDVTQVVSKVEFTTSPWRGPKPTAWQLAEAMKEAGVGGSSSMVYCYDELPQEPNRQTYNTAPVVQAPAVPYAVSPQSAPVYGNQQPRQKSSVSSEDLNQFVDLLNELIECDLVQFDNETREALNKFSAGVVLSLTEQQSVNSALLEAIKALSCDLQKVSALNNNQIEQINKLLKAENESRESFNNSIAEQRQFNSDVLEALSMLKQAVSTLASNQQKMSNKLDETRQDVADTKVKVANNEDYLMRLAARPYTVRFESNGCLYQGKILMQACLPNGTLREAIVPAECTWSANDGSPVVFSWRLTKNQIWRPFQSTVQRGAVDIIDVTEEVR